MVWRSAEWPLAAGGLGDQLLALTTSSPLRPSTLAGPSFLEGDLRRCGSELKAFRISSGPDHSPVLTICFVICHSALPHPHQGTSVLGPATLPLEGGLYHMTKCAPPEVVRVVVSSKIALVGSSECQEGQRAQDPGYCRCSNIFLSIDRLILYGVSAEVRG